MIIQSYELFPALGAPQATPGEGQGETHGADTFAQFLAQDAETLGSLVALLAPFSQSPTHSLPLQPHLAAFPLDPSFLEPANVDDSGYTEEENHTLEGIVDALQTLLPTMLPSILQAPFAAPVTATAGVATLSLPQDGMERLAGLSQDSGFLLHAAPLEGVEGQEVVSPTPQIVTEPILVTAAGEAVTVPSGRNQTATGGDERQVSVFDASGVATPEAQPTVPEPHTTLITGNLSGTPRAATPEDGNTERTGGAIDPSQGRQANTPTAASPLSLPTHSAQEDEVTLRYAIQAEQHGGARAIALKAGSWQPARFSVSMDTGALMSEEISPVHKVQTPSLAPASTETVPVSSTAFAEVGRFPLRHGELRLSAEQSTTADLPIQAQLPGQQAVGSLRYVPVSRDTVLLQLEPPELGTLLVQVRQVNEQLTASFWAESSDVRSLLQAHFPALNQVLSQQGLAVQQISLHLATGNGFAEQFGQFSQQHGTSQTFSHGSREESSGGRHSALDSPIERYQVGNGRVDIRI